MYLVLVLSQYIVDSIKQRVICITVFSQCPTWEEKNTSGEIWVQWEKPFYVIALKTDCNAE